MYRQHVWTWGADSAGAQPAEGDLVSGGHEPPAVLGEDREETLRESPADQPGASERSDRRTAAQGGRRRAPTPLQARGEKALWRDL